MQTTNARTKPLPQTSTSARAPVRSHAQEGTTKPKAPVQDAAYYRAMADGYFSFWFEGNA